MSTFKKVKVIWLDSWSDMEYLEVDAANHVTAAIRENVGYLLRVDQEVLVLTSGIIDNLFKGKTRADGIQVIPTCMVKGVLELNNEIQMGTARQKVNVKESENEKVWKEFVRDI